jgi:type I restriction enzyme R subunit
MSTPSYSEWHDSQKPALELLQRLGYKYLSPKQALAARGNSESRVILADILEQQLRKLNRIEFKGKTWPFSDENIFAAIEALQNPPDLGVVRTNEYIYDLLTLGKSLEQNIAGDRKSFSLKYIDWSRTGGIDNNVYHVTGEFRVAGNQSPRRPDIVLFVNGIPFVVIECKRRDKEQSLEEGISQMLRNQKRDEGIPRLFYYAQLLLAVHPNEAKFATAGTEKRYWAVWKEPVDLDPIVAPLLTDDSGTARLPTEQDRILYALCRRDRLMELAYKFILFEAGVKKIARYNQYFAVKKIVERIHEIPMNRDKPRWNKVFPRGRRKGGVIWHTQGSGKSLTMVLLAKAIALDDAIANPRVLLVTDRVDLDDQIWKTFHYCGKEPQKAATGQHLLDLLRDESVGIITTVIDKFDAVRNKSVEPIESTNIFVLVDESHRSQYGVMHARMRKILPNACYLGFTGTPLMKAEKSTAHKFGGIIDTYSIEQAVQDKAVVPLLYEGRLVREEVHKRPLDRGFQRVAEPLTPYQTRDLKKKFSTPDEIANTEQVIEEIAYDIREHYTKTWQGTGLKAQLAAARKTIAIKFHDFFEREGKVKTAVLISPPDTREGHEDIYEEADDRVQQFWKKMMEIYGSEQAYNKQIISSFKSEDGIELIIVVDKLLTGFDAPRNTVLYIHKKMQEHTLLQAIARVNRPFEGKDFGYIIDYRGILKALDQALTTYSALADFDEEDLKGALININEEIEKLPQYHADVWEIFKELESTSGGDAFERLLAGEEIRHEFYERLTRFLRTLQMALSSEQFHERTHPLRIEKFVNDSKLFMSLRRSVQQRYAETIDYKEYEARIKKLVDTHITAEEVMPITQPVNIFDRDAFRKEVERVTGSAASKADMIAHQMKRTLTERMDEDPALYKKFSELIQEAINDFRDNRLEELAYLNRVNKIYDDFTGHRFEGVPEILTNKPEARAYYGVMHELFAEKAGQEVSDEANAALAAAGIRVQEIIENLKIVDWQTNTDIEKNMRNEIEDYLLELGESAGGALSFDEIDLILDQAIRIAKTRG